MPQSERITTSSNQNKEVALQQASDALKEAYGNIVRQNLKCQEDIVGFQVWNKLKASSGEIGQTINLFDHLTSYQNISGWHPSEADACRQLLINQTDMFDQMGRTGELLKLITYHSLGSEPDFPVSEQSRNVYRTLTEMPAKDGLPVDVIELLSSDRLSFDYKSAWIQKTVIPAVRFLKGLDDNENAQRKIISPERELNQADESTTSEPPDFRHEIALGMSEPPEAKLDRKANHFTINHCLQGYYRCSVRDRWNGDALSFSRSPVEMKPYNISRQYADSKNMEIVGTLPKGKMIALPVKDGFLPVEVSTSAGTIQIHQTVQDEFILDGTTLKSLDYTVTVNQTEAVRRMDKPGVPYDFSGFSISTGLDQQLKKWKRESKNIEETAGKIVHYIKTNFTYSNDSHIGSLYKNGKKEEYFARIEKGKLVDCDVANGFYAFLLARCGIYARLVEGYYADKKHIAQDIGYLGGHNSHVWVELWNGSEWKASDATPSSDENQTEDENDGDKNDQENAFNDLIPEILSEAEIEEIIRTALEEIESGEKERQQQIEEFAREAGCDKAKAEKIIRRLEEARLKSDRDGNLYQTLMRDAWLKLRKDLEKPRKTRRMVRLSDGGELDDEEEFLQDVAVGERDPGGFIKEKTILRKICLFDGIDVIFIGDKSSSMEEMDPNTNKPKKEDQLVLGFLLHDTLYQASRIYAAKSGTKERHMDIRSCQIVYGAIDPRTRKMVNPSVIKSLSSRWNPKDQFEVFDALDSNFGGSTPDYSGLECARKTFEEDDKSGDKVKKRLRLILLLTDGGSDSVPTVQKEQKLLEENGYLLRVAGIGQDAIAVEKVYRSSGKHLKSFDDAYSWLTTQVIDAANKIAV